MSDVLGTPHIEESDTEEVVELPDEHPGVEDGEVVATTVPAEESGGQVSELQERIVFDYDDEGNQIGWHKETV